MRTRAVPESSLRFFFVLLLCLAAGGWAVAHQKNGWVAPDEAKKLKNPVPADDAALAAGKATYTAKCASCHGDTGKGDGDDAMMYSVKPADFTDAHMMAEMTDGEIFWKMGEGKLPMPAFKKRLTDEQRWQLVNYIRTFAPKPPASPAPPPPPPAKPKAQAPPHK
jgi:mono/diheme cytochrome c family protein